MKDFVIKTLIKDMNDDLDAFSSYGKDTFDKIEALKKKDVKYGGSLLRIVFRGNKFICEECGGDNRSKDVFKLIENVLEYAKSMGRMVPDMTVYVRVSDSYAYEYQDLPIFIFAKPINKKGILFPDNTFVCHQVINKCENWDRTVRLIDEKCKGSNIEKRNEIFFKGANTGAKKYNLRYLLSEERIPGLPLKIVLETQYEPMYSFCNSKYLLNLPGHQPWSYRFKYLFLMRSLVINVAVRVHYSEVDYNDKWINFFDNIFVPGEDYVELVYDWYENSDNGERYRKLVREIKGTYDYYEAHPEEYNKMVDNGYRKVKTITNKFVYEMFYDLLVRYNRKLVN
ncbi:MAG: putative O-glucosyltransferase rum-like protein [Hyperionvirus sp.]|uniref:Putative O-glucosyltransferase rum-like protein n=1 Tax=Hyperionvirus sp. TaxID=2487770 RepID=A0A3G5A696_9VIRU|nr:MAG: putative O-glucosyltransferase rum-like protein [Hyperionvirus sp.]